MLRSLSTITVISLALAAPTAAAPTADTPTQPSGMGAAELDTLVTQINESQVADGSIQTIGAYSTADAETNAQSVRAEANRVDAMYDAMQEDGSLLVVKTQSAAVSTTALEGGRLVTLHTVRTLNTGTTWEEMETFVIVDEATQGVPAGTFFAVSPEIVRTDPSVASMADSLGIDYTDESVEPSDTELPPLPPAMQVPSSSTRPTGGTAAGIYTGYSNVANNTTVRDYGRRHALSRNSAYKPFSNDCTSFISQALKAGGWRTRNGWYRDDTTWYYSGGLAVKASWTWAGAENFYRFARNKSGQAGRLPNVYDLRNGDILQYKEGGSANMNHTMVVTKIDNGVPLLSYHTTDTLNKPFTAMGKSGRTWFATAV